MAAITEGTVEKKRKKKNRAAGEGSLYFDAKQNLWIGSVMVGYRLDGKPDRRKVKAKRQDECLEKLSALKARAAGGLLPESDKARDTLGAFLDRSLESVTPSLRASTHKRYADLIRLHLKPGLGRHKLTALKPDHVQRFYALKLAETNPNTVREDDPDASRPYSPRTVQQCHAVLHRALDRAVKWGYAPRNVADAVDPPRVPKHEITPPSLADLARFLSDAERAGDRLAALWAVALYSGCRQGELLGLKWGDVDLEGGTLTVRRTLVRATAGVPVFNEPKTSTSRRTLSLAGAAVAALRSQRVRQNAERLALGEGWSDYGLVFTSTIGTPLNQRNVIRLFKAALERVGLPSSVRFHDLRHASATVALAAGVDMKTTSTRLGHSTITITADLYTHAVRALDVDAAERMERALRGAV